jgi:RNA polymerase sigma factor (sigma-70 family)
LQITAGRATPRFDELVQRLRPSLHTVARRLLGDPGQAEEIVQDTFMKLATDPVLERPDDEVAAWLRRVTVNGALNRARGERRARDRVDRAGRLETSDTAEVDSPLSEVLAREERDRVRRALEAIPERQATVLVLRASGHSYAEIAAAAECAVGSVGVLLARGEKALRAAYMNQTQSSGGTT